MSIQMLFFAFAVVCWFLGGFNVSTPRVNWMVLGMAFAGVALWIV